MQDTVLRTLCDACGIIVEYGDVKLRWIFCRFKGNAPHFPGQTRHYCETCWAGFNPNCAENGISLAGNAEYNLVN